MSEVCQNGIDGVLPAWCVEYNLTPEWILQGAIELFIMIVAFFGLFYFFKWRRKIKQEKEWIKRKLQENT
jgi:hypothetical protein